MSEAADRLLAELSIKPSPRFRQLMQRLGAVGAMKAQLTPLCSVEGLMRLWSTGQLEESAEFIALRPEYRELFTEEELELAEHRLTQLGFRWQEELDARNM